MTLKAACSDRIIAHRGLKHVYYDLDWVRGLTQQQNRILACMRAAAGGYVGLASDESINTLKDGKCDKEERSVEEWTMGPGTVTLDRVAGGGVFVLVALKGPWWRKARTRKNIRAAFQLGK